MIADQKEVKHHELELPLPPLESHGQLSLICGQNQTLEQFMSQMHSSLKKRQIKELQLQ